MGAFSNQMTSREENPILDRFRTWNRLRISRRRHLKPAVETPFGFKMNAIPEMLSGQFEPVETAFVRTLLGRCDRFVNVGANTGFYCCLAQQAGVSTVALEPVPSNVEFIIQNMQANNWGRKITVLPVAAGEEAGFADIFGIGTGASLLQGWARNPSSMKQAVPVVRIEDCVTPPADGERVLILMDVEGYEYFALRGAGAFVEAASKPAWMIEVFPGETGSKEARRAKDTFDLMHRAGYRAVTVDLTPEEATGPREGSSNFLFFDARLSVDDVLGPENERVKPLV